MSSVTKVPGVSSILLFSGSGINFLRPLYYRFVVPAHHTTQPGGIGSLESILGLLKSLKIPAQISSLVQELGGSATFLTEWGTCYPNSAMPNSTGTAILKRRDQCERQSSLKDPKYFNPNLYGGRSKRTYHRFFKSSQVKISKQKKSVFLAKGLERGCKPHCSQYRDLIQAFSKARAVNDRFQPIFLNCKNKYDVYNTTLPLSLDTGQNSVHSLTIFNPVQHCSFARFV